MPKTNEPSVSFWVDSATHQHHHTVIIGLLYVVTMYPWTHCFYSHSMVSQPQNLQLIMFLLNDFFSVKCKILPKAEAILVGLLEHFVCSDIHTKKGFQHRLCVCMLNSYQEILQKMDFFFWHQVLDFGMQPQIKTSDHKKCVHFFRFFESFVFSLSTYNNIEYKQRRLKITTVSILEIYLKSQFAPCIFSKNVSFVFMTPFFWCSQNSLVPLCLV